MSDNDTYTEVTKEGWGSRIGNSLKGIIGGVVLIIGAFGLLIWNESRAVRAINDLKEMSSKVVSLNAPVFNSLNNAKLIHFSGKAETQDILSDDAFNLKLNAIHLIRNVEMYQWKEKEETDSKKDYGGGKTTVKKYIYNKVWSSEIINSAKFKKQGYDNPNVMPYEKKSSSAQNVNVGDFQLNDSLIKSIHTSTEVPITKDMLKAMDADERAQFTISGNTLYRGDDPADPEIGDMRITFSVVMPMEVSVIAQQNEKNLVEYFTKTKSSKQFLSEGIKTAALMIEQQRSMEGIITWILRIIGLVLMCTGIGLIFKPLETVLDVLPFLGNIMGFGIGIFSGVLGFALSFITIAISWIVFRPILGIVLLASGVGVFLFFGIIGKKKQAPA